MSTNRHERTLTFIEHLEELRQRLIICVVVVIVFTGVGFFFANPLLTFLIKPFKASVATDDPRILRIVVQEDGTLRLHERQTTDTVEVLRNPEQIVFQFEPGEGKSQEPITFGKNLNQQFYYFNPIDPFLLRLKAALIIGLLLSFPVLLWQGWLFFTPALEPKERRSVIPITVSALILFPIGAAFAYFFTRYALLFLSRYTFPGLEPRLNIFKYLNFLLTMMLALGIVFETPLILMLLARLGLVTTEKLRRFRGQIYVGIFVLAALLTPPDAFTMLALGVPLVLLFEISMFLIKPIERRTSFI